MEQSLLMATDTHTPISYYMGMPLCQLVEWIRTANRAFEKRDKAVEEKRKQRK